MKFAQACIYCPNEANGREHWLPRLFGNFKGFSYLLNRICKSCNLALGSEIDLALARTGPTAFRREALGIQGRRSHKRINPFHYQARQKQPPTSLWMTSEQGREILAEVAGAGAARPTRQVVVALGNRTACVPFPPAWTAEDLRAGLSARDLAGAQLLEMYLGPDEDQSDAETLEPLLKAVFGKFDAVLRYGYTPGIVETSTVRLSANMDDTYARALAKVAFHYTLWTVPELTGHEPEFEGVRRFIRWGAGESHHFVQLLATQMMPDLDRAEWPEAPHHFLVTYVHPQGASAAVRFFIDRQHRLPPSLVELARSGPCRTSTKIMRGHLATYWPERLEGYDGFLAELPVHLHP